MLFRDAGWLRCPNDRSRFDRSFGFVWIYLNASRSMLQPGNNEWRGCLFLIWPQMYACLIRHPYNTVNRCDGFVWMEPHWMRHCGTGPRTATFDCLTETNRGIAVEITENLFNLKNLPECFQHEKKSSSIDIGLWGIIINVVPGAS